MKNLSRISLSVFFALGVFAVVTFGQAPNCEKTDFNCLVAVYSRQINASPNDFEAYYSRGMAYESLDRIDEAIADFTRYISSNPANKQYLADGYGERAKCYRRLNMASKAIADYNMSIQLNPSTTNYNNRGIYYMAQNDNAAAIADFNRALTIDAKDPEPYYNRAKVYSAQKLYAKAIADLDIYVKLNTTNIPFLADGYQNRSLEYVSIGNLPQALKDVNYAIELDPSVAARYSNRAIIYRKQGKIALAEADEKRAAELKQSTP